MNEPAGEHLITQIVFCIMFLFCFLFLGTGSFRCLSQTRKGNKNEGKADRSLFCYYKYFILLYFILFYRLLSNYHLLVKPKQLFSFPQLRLLSLAVCKCKALDFKFLNLRAPFFFQLIMTCSDMYDYHFQAFYTITFSVTIIIR